MHIRNGYRLCLAQPALLADLKTLVEDFKECARPILQEACYQRIAEIATGILDFYILDMKPRIEIEISTEEAPLDAAVRLALHRYQTVYRGNPNQDARHDFDTHVTAFCPDESTVLAMLFTSNAAVQELWESYEAVEPFVCWNDAERPSEVSEEEWAIRETLWEDALQGCALSVAGFTTECFGIYGMPIPTHEEVLERVPPKGLRARQFAEKRVLEAYLTKHTKDAESPADLHFRIAEAARWLREDREAQAAINGEAETIEGLLLDVTMDLLLQPVNLCRETVVAD